MEIAIIILSVLVVVLGYTTFNLLRKNEHYEDALSAYQEFIRQFQKQVVASDKKLKEIDSKGLFDSDDEIGWFFTQLKEIQKNLTEFKIEF